MEYAGDAVDDWYFYWFVLISDSNLAYVSRIIGLKTNFVTRYVMSQSLKFSTVLPSFLKPPLKAAWVHD